MPEAPTPEMLKRMRIEEEQARESSPNGPSAYDKGKSRAAFVRTEEEEEEEASARMDTDFAPNGDADYFAEEDEEGRFYGGGLTSEQKEILNIFDQVGGEGVQDDVSCLLRGSYPSNALR